LVGQEVLNRKRRGEIERKLRSESKVSKNAVWRKEKKRVKEMGDGGVRKRSMDWPGETTEGAPGPAGGKWTIVVRGNAARKGGVKSGGVRRHEGKRGSGWSREGKGRRR